MRRQFVKMHGCGNDYIFIDAMEHSLSNPEKWAALLSDRHFGIGGDGLVLIEPSALADAKMRMFNADGSEGRMCGNAIRCVGKFLCDRKMKDVNELFVQTLSGIKHLKMIRNESGIVVGACVDMGAAETLAEKIPLKSSKKEVIHQPLVIGDKKYTITCVSMGNPHCIIFCENPENVEIEKIAPEIQKHSVFPQGVNVEFVQVISENALRMRVYERGSGETLACGTGACAAVTAAVLNGYCQENTEVAVRLRGGELAVRYTKEQIFMTGEAVEVFEGSFVCED